MKRTQRLLWWFFAALSIVALLILLGDVLAPFYLSIAIAFVLDPLCDLLERMHFPRSLAVLVVMMMFALLVVGAFILLVPVIIQQIVDLIDSLPRYVERVTSLLRDWAAQIQLRTGLDVIDQVRTAMGSNEQFVSWISSSLGQLLTSSLTLSRRLIEIGIVVVVVFFILLDFDRIFERLATWLPPAYARPIQELAKEAYDMLRGFVRGQGLVCVILGTFYAVSLTAIGLQFGILVGLTIGFISFIPYVGATIGLITSLSLAILEFDSWFRVGGVAAIFFFGQMIEGNILVPLLVGDRVRLHPVWVILGLYVGGVLFGFFGVLLAVPITAVIGVFARFILKQYLESSLYQTDR